MIVWHSMQIFIEVSSCIAEVSGRSTPSKRALPRKRQHTLSRSARDIACGHCTFSMAVTIMAPSDLSALNFTLSPGATRSSSERSFT